MANKTVKRAGVIPYYIEEDQIKMMFMQPADKKYGGDNFQIAKGKLEDGEDPKQGGLREAAEELGLFSGNIKETYDLGKFLNNHHIYVSKIKDPDMFGDHDEETAAVKWMTAEQFEAEGRVLHKPIIKAAVRLIKKKENLK